MSPTLAPKKRKDGAPAKSLVDGLFVAVIDLCKFVRYRIGKIYGQDSLSIEQPDELAFMNVRRQFPHFRVDVLINGLLMRGQRALSKSNAIGALL